MSNVEDTGILRVMEALREVTNPEVLLGIFVANTTSDAMIPMLQPWLREQIQQMILWTDEYVEPKFRLIDLRELPTEELISTAMFAIGATETCAAITQWPTLVKFALEFQKVAVACMACRLLQAEDALASTE